MNALRPGLPPLPARMKGLPIRRGLPVPYFVGLVGGDYDFQLADPEKRHRCLHHDLCWICGQPMGVFKTFVLGPLAAMNRISGEPPSHIECAEFAALACPFLTLAMAERGSTDADKEMMPAGGVMMLHNPGVFALWNSKNPPKPRVNRHDVLLDVGEPTVVRWYTLGRLATRAEVLAGIEAGLDRLRNEPGDPYGAATIMAVRRDKLLPYLPRETDSAL